jgi:hypothetical protein
VHPTIVTNVDTVQQARTFPINWLCNPSANGMLHFISQQNMLMLIILLQTEIRIDRLTRNSHRNNFLDLQ